MNLMKPISKLDASISWSALAPLAHPMALRFSWGAAIMVPILARLQGLTIQYLPDTLFGMLDSGVHLIPSNLLRLFWSAFFVLCGQLLFRISAPPITRCGSAEEWMKLPSNKRHLATGLHEYGEESRDRLERDLRNDYDLCISDADTSIRRPLRYLTALSYMIAFLLLSCVLLDQFIMVANHTDLSTLLTLRDIK